MQKRTQHLLIILLYALVALVVIGHWPTTLAQQFIGTDTGDTYEMARNVWWFTFAIEHGEPLFYQTWLGYPDGINGSILLTVPLQYFPMWGLAFLLPLPLAYNLTVVLWMALNGWSMFVLVRSLLGEESNVLAAFGAGVVYMAFPIFQGHLAEGHAGLLVAWAAPLYVLALFRYASAEQHVWRWLAACILLFYLSTTGHILQAIYVLMPVSGVFLLGKLWQRDWRAARRITGMGIVASALLLVLLSPAIIEATSEVSYSSTGGYSRYSADLLAVVSPSFLHPVYDSLLVYPRAVLGTNLAEGQAYLGIIVAVLALLAIWKVKAARWWLLLAAVAWLLSLGPVLKLFDTPISINGTMIPLPFALFTELPGFSLARTPARFNFTLALAIAVLAGYGLHYLLGRVHKRWHLPIVIVLVIGILFEYQAFWPQPLRPAAIPDAVTALRDDPSIRAVFNIPYQHALAAKDALYLQTGHQQPLIAGQITRTTPVNPARLAMLQGTLDPLLLLDAGADIVILHRSRAQEIGTLAELEDRANQQLGSPIFVDERIAIYRVPDASGNPGLSYEITRPNIALSGEMTLIGYDALRWDGDLFVWLQWQFNGNRPDSDVRFVHIVDETGEVILQDDRSPGSVTDGEIRTELLHFDLAALDAGQYSIRTGWYDFTTLTNYVTADGAGMIQLDDFTITD